MRVPETSPSVDQAKSRRWAWARIGALGLVVVVVVFLRNQYGWPDVDLLRTRVEDAGSLGALVFVGGYVVLSLLPVPKAVLTALGGLVFGLWWGALLSWLAALIGANVAFVAGRALGRQAVDTLTGGRVQRADELLTEHGLGAVMAVRLVPVIPFTAINYSAGLTGVRWRDYALGSALGMLPGSLAYAAIGAWGTDPWGLFAALAALVALVVIGGLYGRHLLGSRNTTGSNEKES